MKPEEFLNTVESGAIASDQNESYSNYNVAPTHEMPVAFVDENRTRFLETMHWGFGMEAKVGQKAFSADQYWCLLFHLSYSAYHDRHADHASLLPSLGC